jgi:hypothetical protein
MLLLAPVADSGAPRFQLLGEAHHAEQVYVASLVLYFRFNSISSVP